MGVRVFAMSKSRLDPIRKSSTKKDWMSGNPNNHAYKCPPLTLANSHGWEILLPHEVVVEWNGGNNKTDLRILKGAERSDGTSLPKSIFGQGVITFQLPYLFVTEEPYNLFVSGPPNYVVPGASALTGTIETFWSPYSFTMNWRITDIDKPVVFPAGSPYMFFFPVDSMLVEKSPVSIHDYSEYPYKEEYKKFGLQRAAANEKTRAANKSGYLELDRQYLNGVDPDGCPMANPEYHRSKLKTSDPINYTGVDMIGVQDVLADPAEQ
jgi:hypothetical protein